MVLERRVIQIEGKTPARNHKVNFVNRKDGYISGVKEVISFDVDEVKVDTDMGILMIRGSGMHLKRLNLEKGEIDIEGNVESFVYDNKTKKNTESLLKRLFC